MIELLNKFRPMKADHVVLDKIKYPVFVSPKIDGIRIVSDEGKTYSNSLKEIPNIHIQEMIKKLYEEPELDKIILDGEGTVGDSFQACTSGIMSRDGESDFTYSLFDCIYVSERLGRALLTPEDLHKYRTRKNLLASLNLDKKYDWIKIVPTYLVNNEEELLQKYQEFLDMGYEGMMVRNPIGLYKFGRSTVNQGYLLKLKALKDAEAKVIGFEEQMRNENEATEDNLGLSKRSSHKENKVGKNTLGKFWVEDLTTGKKFKIGNGKGLTHELRQEIWDNQDKYMDKIIKYSYQEIGMKDLPRIPLFLGFRHEADL